jgi:hypothetical protein
MANWKARLATPLAVGLLLSTSLSAGQRSVAPVTAEDRAGIEALLGRYLLALGSCDAQKYAALFVTPDGFFAAGTRGKVDGQHRLTEMIKSYDCNYVNGVAPPHAPNPSAPYKLVVEPVPGGAIGFAYLNGARYEDEYVKTAHGWLFRSRTVVTNKELAAKLTREDFEAIQQLALRNAGPYVDLYEKRPDGTSRFKSAGVALSVAPAGVIGQAYLKDGGHYEDVYVKGQDGWRFQSRIYVPADAPSADGTDRR